MLMASLAMADTTVTEPGWTLGKITIIGSSKASEDSCIGSAKTQSVGTYVCTPGATIISITAPPPVVPPSTGTTWGYYSGQWNWAGDFTQNGTSVNYHDTTGMPMSGSQDILFTSTVPWGLWLPYFSSSYMYPNPGYRHVTLSIKTTAANQSIFTFYFVRVGDKPTGVGVVLAPKYGPMPVVGQWETYVVPLVDVGIGTESLYKFGVQDQSGTAGKFYIDNVGFTLN